jgi:hypothetical protein
VRHVRTIRDGDELPPTLASAVGESGNDAQGRADEDRITSLLPSRLASSVTIRAAASATASLRFSAGNRPARAVRRPAPGFGMGNHAQVPCTERRAAMLRVRTVSLVC